MGNQSSNYAKTLKGEFSLQSVYFGTNPKWMARRHRLSRHAAFGERFKRTTPRHRPSRFSASGKRFKRTTPRPRPSRHAAFGERFERTPPGFQYSIFTKSKTKSFKFSK